MGSRRAGSEDPRGKTSFAAAANDEVTLSELRQVLVRRRVPFLLCVAAGVLVAAILSILLPRRYEATAQLTVDFETGPSSSAAAFAEAVGVADPTKLQTQVSILQTDSIAWEVIKRLRLDQQSAALPRRFGFGAPLCETPAGRSFDTVDRICQRKLLNEFHERLHVQALPRTEIVEIRYRSGSPDLSAQVVNALSSIYVEEGIEADYRSSLRGGEWLSGQLDGLRKESQEAEEKLLRFQRQSGLLATDDPQSLQLTELTELNQQVVTARAQRIAQEARYRTAMTGDPEAMVGIAQGTTLQALHAEEVGLSNQYAQLEAKFGDAYPRVIQLKEQLAKAHADTVAELNHSREKIKLELDAAKTDETLLQSMFDRQKQEIFDAGEAGVQLAMLRRDVDASHELYDQVLKRARLGNVTAGINKRDIELIDPPMVPVQRVEPHPAVNMVAGLFLGAFSGLVLCGVLEGADGRIATLRLLDQVCPLRGVSIIPELTARERAAQARLTVVPNSLNSVAAIDLPASATADAYRAVRTALLHSQATAVPRVILVASPRAGEGKTATSTNLAVVMAQMSRRVLLVDADLHGNGLTPSLHVSRGTGLAELLMRKSFEAAFLQQPGLPGLMILPAGVPDRSPADLLESEHMRELIQAWRSSFDHVILEAPPVLEMSDAVVLATLSDTVLLSLRAGRGRRADLNRVLDMFSSVNAHVSGAIAHGSRADIASDREPARYGREEEAAR